jgi:hypothetical protein
MSLNSIKLYNLLRKVYIILYVTYASYNSYEAYNKMAKTTKTVAVSIDFEDIEYLKNLRLGPSELIRETIFNMRHYDKQRIDNDTKDKS